MGYVKKMSENLNRYKMVLFGSPSVGKTSLVDRFIHDKFEPNYFFQSPHVFCTSRPVSTPHLFHIR